MHDRITHKDYAPDVEAMVRKKRVCAYARVSSEKDEAFHSLSAQVSYYQQKIAEHSDWEFVEVFSDRGLTGTKENRLGFQAMLTACRNHEVDIVLAKSLTRFARNTVILLNTVRELKSLGIDIHFEEEHIETLSAKGELMISILAARAQEESRSASENQNWRIRKSYEKGVPVTGDCYGYRMVNHQMLIDEDEEEIVLRIFSMYLSGMGCPAIPKQLNKEGVKTRSGKTPWSISGISHIISNEKYVGDLRLQKSYTTDYISKKKLTNHGERPQYYVQDAHEAIIPPAQFDRVQKEMQRRFGDTDRHGCVSIFSSKIRCGDCGGFYGSKVWHSNDKYRKVIWRCNHKYDDGKNCSTPHLDEDTIKALYLKALRILGEERDEIIATFEAIKDEMYDTAELETEQAALQQEVMVVTELVEQCISENAHVAQNQKDYQKKYDALSERYDRTKERLDKVSGRIMERQAKREMIEAFLHDLAEMDEDVQEFTDDLWFNLLDHVTVFSKKDVRFTFKNGTEISVK